MEKTNKLSVHAFVIAVPDLRKTTQYFEEALGFCAEWGDGNWQTLSRDGVRVMIGHCPGEIPPAELGDHSYFAYLHADDVDALHKEFSGKGVIVLHVPTNKPWGMREMAIATPDGHRMMIGQRLVK